MSASADRAASPSERYWEKPDGVPPLTVGGWYGRIGVEILRGSECVAVVGRLQANRLAHLDTVRSANAKRGEQAHHAEAEAQGLEAGQAGALALARQFAASPDLLDACRAMVECCGPSENWQGETHEALNRMEAAIAKAEGRQ